MSDKPVITAVILCGGSGTRLWPLSRSSFPKQFVPLIAGKCLLELTLERVAQLGASWGGAPVMCVAAEDHRFLVGAAMQSAGVPAEVILEPVARNTAAAMALAALRAKADDLLLFCPADHHIPDVSGFVATVEAGREAANNGAFVTFGVVPTFPSTAYGYIERGTANPDKGFAVTRFIEKPSFDKAGALILQGNVLWNAGIFLVKASVLIVALQEHAADILEACAAAMAGASRDGHFIRPEASAFASCRPESIDYAVLERHSNVVVIPFSGAWSDVGSWNAVAELTPPDAQGNRVGGQGLVVHATRTFIHAPIRPVVALGTDGLLIIDTPDALLVVAATHAEQVKLVVAELAAVDSPQATLHRKVSRPWGWYDSIDCGERFQVKRINVKPGGSLSLQRHRHRAEHWIVVKGRALVTKGSETFMLAENESTYIPIGEIHRLENPGEMDLEMIEVQSGSYLGEDDIERFNDVYGRV